MDKKPKNKGGRPKEDVADKVDFEQIEKLAGYGHTDVEMANILGVCEQTLNNYKKDERFVVALKHGRDQATSEIIAALHKRAKGYSYKETTYEAIKYANGTVTKNEKVKTVIKQVEPNPTCMIFILKNRLPERYRDVRPDAPGDKLPDEIVKFDKLIADAETRVERAGETCH